MQKTMIYRLAFGWCLLSHWARPALAVVDTVTEITLAEEHVASAFQPRRLALFIGVESFQDDRFRPLQFPQKDVSDFQNFLASHNANEHDVAISVFGPQATAKGVLAALDELERKNTSADDIVLVYLSTHGTLDYENARSLKRFAVMHDTDFDAVAKTGVSMDYLQTRLSRLKSNRKALVLALCHSGSGKSQLPAQIQSDLSTMKAEFFTQPLHEVSSAMMVLSASSWGQPAREDEFLRNDIYTHFLIKGLSEHDANLDGAISLFEAHEYARTRTYDYTRGQQTPSALLNVAGTDPIILNGQVKRSAQPMIFADSDRFRNVQIAVNGQNKGTLWNPKALPEGRVRLTLVDPRNPGTPMLDHHVYVNKAAALAVSSLFERTPTTGLEMRFQRLPAPLAIVGNKADLWTPGIYVRSSEILGSRFTGGAGYMARTIEREITVDYELSKAQITMSHMRADVGLSFYPTAHQSLSFLLGVEAMSMERQVNNPTFTDNQQSGFAVYPSLTVDWRLLEIVSRLYAGTYASVLPSQSVGFSFNDEFYPIDPLSMGGLVGFTF